jgi:long-chain fatty acid transport protein
MRHVIYHAAVRWSRGLIVAASLAAGSAQANPGEVFGLGSANAARVGAVSAVSEDFASPYYNPAGAAFSTEKRLTIGALAAASQLEINDQGQSISEPIGGFFGATLPAPVGGVLENKVVIALAIYAPAVIARVIAHLPDEPFNPYYDNRTQRLVIQPALAFRVSDRLGLGIGLDILAGVNGGVVAVEGPTRALEPRVDEEIGTRLGVHLGARWDVGGGHRLALVYRQAFGVTFSTVAAVEVAGEPINLDLSAEGLYTPHQLVAGYAWATDDLVLSADATFALWSAYDGPYVRVASALPLVGALPGRSPAVPFENTVSLRAGVEKRLGDVLLRGGYGYETSPIPSGQHGITNLVDGPKHLFGLGAGFVFGRVRIDLHAQLHLVGERVLEKRIAGGDSDDDDLDIYDALRDEVVDDPNEPSTLGVQISNPGFPSIRGGGRVISGGLSVEWTL